MFLVVQAVRPDRQGGRVPGRARSRTRPIAQGWLRASHRKLDPKLSLPYRPYHAHDENRPLTPGEVVELDIEIWPTCIVVPAGYRIGLTVRGKDYVVPGPAAARLSNMKKPMTGCGPFLHDDPRDRPPRDLRRQDDDPLRSRPCQHVLLPIIPPKRCEIAAPAAMARGHSNSEPPDITMAHTLDPKTLAERSIADLISLKGRRAVITGGARGLGLAIGRRLARPAPTS